ncbi:hypothetical protein BV22DRAFT_1128128 [Leucogyrophana mollusca]|uniref:Uncharacterized protein n=1 Tax=Leucogyrophana mollusca TaxID=85980 RepID=A0ACB8BPP3_9AGAM|nr:hypothetical protein BV22DRAFT_1128128 [Leucogyrophana mollusca]
MQKLKEDWTSHSITSVFRIKHNNGRPVGCEVACTRVFTDECGLGWQFGICYDKAAPEIDIFFRCTGVKVVPPIRQVRATVRLLKDDDSEGNSLKEESNSLSIPFDEESRFVSWDPSDIVSHPFIAFTMDLGKGVTLDDIIQKRQTSMAESAAHSVLKHALRTGISFDTKFLAFSGRGRLRESDVLLPVYAHSAVLDAMVPNLFHSQFLTADIANGPQHDLEAPCDKYELDSDVDVDVDVDEGEGEGKGEEKEKGAHIEERTPLNRPPATVEQASMEPPPYFPNTTRTILVKDVAFQTWQALIYYCYTGELTFRPLKSKVAENKKPLDPGHISCSPKSMYRLAYKIGSTDLMKRALASIRSSLSEHNILDEAFSQFTSKYPAVQKMELDLLVDYISSPAVTQALPGKMVDVSSGAVPHSHQALTALLRRLSELKK